MSTLEATVSMLEVMPDDDKTKVYEYTQSLFEASKSSNPFVPKTKEDILTDLEESREQISRGEGLDAKEGLMEMGKRHGFV